MSNEVDCVTYLNYSLYFSGQCQVNTMLLRMTIRQIVTEMIVKTHVQVAVNFIVGETAVPSPELIEFAMWLGRAPRTQEEKTMYLYLMQDIARQTPALVEKFMKIEKVNGTDTIVVDQLAMDAHITKRALMYDEMMKGTTQKQQNGKAKPQQHQQNINQSNQTQEYAVASGANNATNPGNSGPMNPQSGTTTLTPPTTMNLLLFSML